MAACRVARSLSGVSPISMVPTGFRSRPQPAHHRVVRHGAGIRDHDVRVVEMLLGDLDHQQRARRIIGVGFVVGRLPGIGDARLDEDDQRRDGLAVERQRMDAAEIQVGEPVDRLARERRAEPVGRHRRALASFPAGGLERQKRLHAVADLFGRARDDMLEHALVAQAAGQAAEVAVVMRTERLTQIFLAVETAFQKRPLDDPRRRRTEGRAVRRRSGECLPPPRPCAIPEWR